MNNVEYLWRKLPQNVVDKVKYIVKVIHVVLCSGREMQVVACEDLQCSDSLSN